MDIELSPRATEIAACARSLLANGGYHSFSYADISAAVGISKASIHHHFPSKAELVKVVLALYRAEARAGMAALGLQLPDPRAQLEAYAGYWATCIQDGTAPFCVCAMLAAELPAIPPELSAEVQGHFQDLAAWLGSALAQGESQGTLLLQASPADEAMAFMATVHGAMLAARATGDPAVFNMIVQPHLRRLSIQ